MDRITPVTGKNDPKSRLTDEINKRVKSILTDENCYYNRPLLKYNEKTKKYYCDNWNYFELIATLIPYINIIGRVNTIAFALESIELVKEIALDLWDSFEKDDPKINKVFYIEKSKLDMLVEKTITPVVLNNIQEYNDYDLNDEETVEKLVEILNKKSEETLHYAFY